MNEQQQDESIVRNFMTKFSTVKIAHSFSEEGDMY